MRKLLAVAVTILVVAPGIATAAETPCLTPRETSQLAAYALPSAIKGTALRCMPQLGGESYLGRKGDALAARYATRKAQNWPGAKAAFMKLSAAQAGPNNPFSTLPDSSLQPMVDALMEGMITQRIPVSECETIDTVLELLDPLPAENTAELIALAVGLTAKSKAGKSATTDRVGNLRICEN